MFDVFASYGSIVKSILSGQYGFIPTYLAEDLETSL